MLTLNVKETCTTVVHTALVRLGTEDLRTLRALLTADPGSPEYPKNATTFRCTATFNTGDVYINAQLDMLDDGPLFTVRLVVTGVEHDVAETVGEIAAAYDLTTMDDGERAAVYRLEFAPAV